MTSIVALTLEQKTPIIRVKPDGSGFELDNGYEGIRAQLQLGNVSIAFDERNVWRGSKHDTYGAVYTQLGEFTDDPVRLNGGSVDPGKGTAEKLLYALAADLGYSVSRND